MADQGIDSTQDDASLAQAVAEYLRRHPEWFAARPSLLAGLNIPHETCAGTVSLVERQVRNLREENARLRFDLQRVHKRSARTGALVDRVHELAMSILRASAPRELFELTRECLREAFAASTLSIYVFSRPAAVESSAGLRFRERDDRVRNLFAELLNSGTPLCDSLQAEHISALFGQGADNTIRSTALIPLRRQGWDGLLALGSREWDQYAQGLDLDLLIYVSHVLSVSIHRWVMPEQAPAA